MLKQSGFDITYFVLGYFGKQVIDPLLGGDKCLSCWFCLKGCEGLHIGVRISEKRGVILPR